MSKIFLANLEDRRGVENPFRTLHFPMGLGLIAGALLTTDHTLGVVDNYVPGTSLADAINELVRACPDYILFTSFLGNFHYRRMKQVTREIKARVPHAVQIMGGPMASCVPELVLDHMAVDHVVIGEGEETILDLIDAIERKRDLAEVPGIAFRRDGGIVLTGPRIRMKKLDAYPFAPHHLFNMRAYLDYYHQTGRCWEISTSRGCYSRCSFCKLIFGNKITFRPIEHVIQEMVYLKENWGIDRFNFVDDNFLNAKRHVDELILGLRHCGHRFRFRFQGRADRMDRVTAKKLVEAGCFGISFGVESGSQAAIDSMNKIFDVGKAKSNLLQLVDSGLILHTSFIVGIPGESHETISATKSFIRETALPNVYAGILTPFPGTTLYEETKARQLIVDDDAYCDQLGTVYEDVYVNLTAFPDEQLRLWKKEIMALGS